MLDLIENPKDRFSGDTTPIILSDLGNDPKFTDRQVWVQNPDETASLAGFSLRCLPFHLFGIPHTIGGSLTMNRNRGWKPW